MALAASANPKWGATRRGASRRRSRDVTNDRRPLPLPCECRGAAVQPETDTTVGNLTDAPLLGVGRHLLLGEEDVLPGKVVVLLEFELPGLGPLVLGRVVDEASARRGHEADIVAHDDGRTSTPPNIEQYERIATGLTLCPRRGLFRRSVSLGASPARLDPSRSRDISPSRGSLGPGPNGHPSPARSL